MINLQTANVANALLSLFFAITFLQSGIDKVLNREGNLSWFVSVFEKTILGKFIAPLFYWITIQELFVGAWMLIAVYCHLFCTCTTCIITDWAYILCMFVLIQLFTGQRIAKDYVGASGIIPYIIVAILGAMIFTGCN